MNKVDESRTHSNINQSWSIVQISASSSCKHCQNPLAINGYEEDIICNKCSGINKITNEGWTRVFKDIKDDLRKGTLVASRNAMLYNPGSSVVNFLYEKQDIRCPVCESAVLFVADTSGNEGIMVCTSCSNKIPYRRATKGIKHGVGGLNWIAGEELSAVRNNIDLTAQNLTQKCPSCGGGLPIDGKHRIVECLFCLSKVTLSEAIWNRLHPSKARKYWYLIFSGFNKSERDLAMERALAQRKKNKQIPQPVKNKSNYATSLPVVNPRRSPYQVWLDQGGYFFIFLWGILIVTMLIMYNQDPLPLNLLLGGQQSIWEQATEQFNLLANNPNGNIEFHPFYILLFIFISGILAVIYYWYIKRKLAKGWNPPVPDDSD